jgi:hypothetical protein
MIVLSSRIVIATVTGIISPGATCFTEAEFINGRAFLASARCNSLSYKHHVIAFSNVVFPVPFFATRIERRPSFVWLKCKAPVPYWRRFYQL